MYVHTYTYTYIHIYIYIIYIYIHIHYADWPAPQKARQELQEGTGSVRFVSIPKCSKSHRPRVDSRTGSVAWLQSSIAQVTLKCLGAPAAVLLTCHFCRCPVCRFPVMCFSSLTFRLLFVCSRRSRRLCSDQPPHPPASGPANTYTGEYSGVCSSRCEV